MSQIDKDVETLVRKYGIDGIIAALARYCNRVGMPVVFRRLNKLYEWLTYTPPGD